MTLAKRSTGLLQGPLWHISPAAAIVCLSHCLRVSAAVYFYSYYTPCLSAMPLFVLLLLTCGWLWLSLLCHASDSTLASVRAFLALCSAPRSRWCSLYAHAHPVLGLIRNHLIVLSA